MRHRRQRHPERAPLAPALRRRARPLGPTDDPPEAAADPSAIEKAERVAIALAELPDHYEAVLRAKYLDRLSVEAIADGARRYSEGR